MSRASDILRERAETWFVAERGSLATRDELRAIADLLGEWDTAAYCLSCGVRQCEPEHGDEHHTGCKRAAAELAITGESEGKP